MHHLYIQLYTNELALQKERERLEELCSNNDVQDYSWIEDNLAVGRIPKKKVLFLFSAIRQGDTVIVYELSRLGRSLSMYGIVLGDLNDRNVTIISLDGRTLTPGPEFDSCVVTLRDIVAIEKNIKAFRSKDIISGKRQEGAVLGRPFGAKKKPEKNVLYGKTEQLDKMLSEGVSTAFIAKELDVSRGTIYNYIMAKKR